MARPKATSKIRKTCTEEKNLFFSDKIRQRRQELGLTQGQFAERLGVWQKQASELENGVFVQNAERVVEIARALETTPDYLFGFREEP